jgi:hypothetical protein
MRPRSERVYFSNSLKRKVSRSRAGRRECYFVQVRLSLAGCASPKLRPNEKSCDPPARAAGQNYLTIGRALERLGVFEPRAELRRKAAGKSKPFAGVPVLIIRQLGRSDGASRPGALETRLYPDPWTELCPPAFPFLGPGACDLHGNRDAKYGLEVPIAVRSMAIRPVRTSFQSPWQNYDESLFPFGPEPSH